MRPANEINVHPKAHFQSPVGAVNSSNVCRKLARYTAEGSSMLVVVLEGETDSFLQRRDVRSHGLIFWWKGESNRFQGETNGDRTHTEKAFRTRSSEGIHAFQMRSLTQSKRVRRVFFMPVSDASNAPCSLFLINANGSTKLEDIIML